MSTTHIEVWQDRTDLARRWIVSEDTDDQSNTISVHRTRNAAVRRAKKEARARKLTITVTNGR